MSSQLIPQDLLNNSTKILFITHMAMGDYTYMQNYFQAFKQNYPHIKIHLWIDEVRRTSDPSKWDNLRRNILHDWLRTSPLFEQIYIDTYSPELLEVSTRKAQEQVYPIVISLTPLRPHWYAKLARSICPHGFTAGIKNPINLFSLHHNGVYKKLNAVLSSRLEAGHITNTYAKWFMALFNIDVVPHARFPFVVVSIDHMKEAEGYLTNWGVDRISDKLVFVNGYAKTKKASWPLDRVAELIIEIKNNQEWSNAWFLINVMPENYNSAKEIINKLDLKRVKLFTADKSFFQLPAMLSLCSLIISVETSIMHLANAVHVPLIALMRKKNPEWAPLDKENSVVVMPEKRRDSVNKIEIDQVIKSLVN